MNIELLSVTPEGLLICSVSIDVINPVPGKDCIVFPVKLIFPLLISVPLLLKFPKVESEPELFIVNVDPEFMVTAKQIAFVLIIGKLVTVEGMTTFFVASGIPPHQFAWSFQLEFIPNQVEVLGIILVVIVIELESTQPSVLVIKTAYIPGVLTLITGFVPNAAFQL